MYLFCICVRAHFIRMYNLTKQILYGLSARKTLVYRGKVCNTLVTSFL